MSTPLDITVLSSTPSPADAAVYDAVIVAVAESATVLTTGLDDALAGELARTATVLGADAAAGALATAVAPAGLGGGKLLLAGVAPVDGDPAEGLRRGVGAATRSLAGAARALVLVPNDDAATFAAIAEGAALGAYTFVEHKGSGTASHAAPLAAAAIVTSVPAEALAPVVERSAALAAGTHAVRDLVNTSPLHLFPQSFADRIAAQAEGVADVTVRVLDDAQLAEQGYGGILGVGQGSSRLPRLVEVSYAPEGAQELVALVGKGITFDTGGISLKPGANMHEMKMDMGGAAVVSQALFTAARLRLPIAITAWLALAENMPSDTAQRPGDIVTMYGGRTVEVLNTDAEGRLVMADALVRASEDSPAVLIDVATLTGAQILGLGNRTAGVMGDPAVRDAVVAASVEAGEHTWPAPLPAYLRESMASPSADLANIGASREAGMLLAGVFLQQFVGARAGTDESIPWAHVDIAGPAWSNQAYGYVAKEGTGMGLRTLVRFLENRVK